MSDIRRRDKGEHVTDPARQEQASPEVQKRIQESFDRQGLMAHLGARISHMAPGRVHIVLPARPEVTQQHGYFHAGATSAIADSAGGYAAYTLFPEDTDVLTVEYKINLLAPAVGAHIEAIGTVLKSGRTLTVCQLEVYGVQADGERRLVANGQQTLIRVNKPAQ
ncbi:PaaI family thioesterase [Streptomyces sp. BP-8]|uniref:PaaI family thioesterase n=1 Tax=Streptomyces sirii TaxID=3127701 RepID=UPI00388E3995